MKKGRAFLLVALLLAVALAAAGYHYRYLIGSQLGLDLGEDAAGVGLRAVADVPLEGSASRFDYQDVDPARGLLFVAHLGSDQVVAYDLRAGNVAGYVHGISSPHGLRVLPDQGRVLVSATGTHQVAFVDEATLQVVGRADGGDFPDGIAYDPQTRLAFVSDESGGADVVIDTRSMQRIDRVDLGGEAGNTQYDATGRQIVAAAQGRGQLALIDPASRSVTAWIDVPGCHGPHGFFLDSPARLAYVSCEDNAKLVVVNLDARRATQAFDVGDAPDVLAFDAGTGRLYVAAESGVVATFHAAGGGLEKLGQAYLAPRAHSVAVDPQTHRVYVPLEDVGGRPVLRVYEPAG